MEGVELGSAEPTEDEEGISALPSGDLRLDPVSVVCIHRLVPKFGLGRSHDTLIHVCSLRCLLFCLILLASLCFPA